jgi:Spy/CpxP family protein refolding chaperone
MRFVCSLLVVLFLGSSTAFAQQPPAQAKRARVIEKIRALRAARIVEVLNLDEATATKLFAVLNRYDDQIFPLKAQVGQTRRELRALIDAGKLDDATGNKLIDKILAARMQIAKLEDQRSAEVRKLLTVRQFATLVVALPEIERDIERQIRQAVERRRRGALGSDDDFE